MGNSLQDRALARNVGHATRELQVLEQPASVEEYRANRHGLAPAPITPAWILEGKPVARGKLLSSSADGMAFTCMWDCTVGRFNWFYDIDETICLQEGSVVLLDSAGGRHHLKSGDTFFFPAGSRFEWTVAHYVRKIAFIHIPLSPKILYGKRIYKAVKRLLRPGAVKDEAHALLHGH